MKHSRINGKAFATLFFGMLLLGCSLFPAEVSAKREHVVHFHNTAYELNIYKIYGKQPGKTLMLIGGIQGNEPGGFLSADLYADMSLEKGNLIVVPRANFYSIILNKRGANGDMNRKFTHENNSHSMEDKIVTILKALISESDYLLNLHDGAGYYYPKYINKWRNPRRFGQTIIADCADYTVPGTGMVIRLKEMAEKVIRTINPMIKNDLYKFHFMNTRTDEKDSPHQEQQRSATYYALTKHHIPAFGVETSKFLPSIDLKVRYHNLVVNEFMKLFGVIPQSPRLALDEPKLKYLVVSINGSVPIVVKDKETLKLHRGDSINISHIESNYDRGLSLDLLGMGDLNDFRKDFQIRKNTSIIVRKDNHRVAEIPVRVSKKPLRAASVPAAPKRVDYFIVETKGHRLLMKNGETLDLVRGDTLKIIDILPEQPESAGMVVNFKGFVGDRKNNTGEDRGYVVDTGKGLIKRYSLNNKGEVYEVVADINDRILGRLIVRLSPPKMDYMVLRVNDKKHLLLKPEEAVTLAGEDRIVLEEIKTNLFAGEDVCLRINGHILRPGDRKRIRELRPSKGRHDNQLKVTKGDLVLGRVFLHTP